MRDLENVDSLDKPTREKLESIINWRLGDGDLVDTVFVDKNPFYLKRYIDKCHDHGDRFPKDYEGGKDD